MAFTPGSGLADVFAKALTPMVDKIEVADTKVTAVSAKGRG